MGASAIYGSDAIAGVVNVITAVADGVSASVYGGAFRETVGKTYEVEFAGGRQGETTSASRCTSATRDAGRVGSGVPSLVPFSGCRHRQSPTAARSRPRAE